MEREQWLPVQAAFTFPSANNKQDLSKEQSQVQGGSCKQPRRQPASALKDRSSSMGTSRTVAHSWVTTKTLTEKKRSTLKVSPIYENITSSLYIP